MTKHDNLTRAHQIAARYLADERLHIDHIDIRDTSVSLWCDQHPQAVEAGWEHAQAHDEHARVASASKKDRPGWWVEVSWREDGFWMSVWSDTDDPTVIERVSAIKQGSGSDYAGIVAAIVAGDSAREANTQ